MMGGLTFCGHIQKEVKSKVSLKNVEAGFQKHGAASLRVRNNTTTTWQRMKHKSSKALCLSIERWYDSF